MKGRSNFSELQASTIRSILRDVRRAERPKQKALRAKLRATGFNISDWPKSSGGFTVSDFDDLIAQGSVTIGSQKSSPPDAHGTEAIDIASTRARPEKSGDSIEEAASALEGVRHSLASGDPDLPAGRGLYAFYGSPETWESIGLGVPPDGRPLYVGKAEASIIERDLRGHVGWPSGETSLTGRSTLRRSVVALLSESGLAELEAIPRNPANPNNFANYGLSREDDQWLTEWMRKSFSLSVWIAPNEVILKSIETPVLGHFLPPLNLAGVSTPWRSMVKSARAIKAAQAKAWAA